MENRTMFDTVTIYELNHIFNKKHSQDLIDFLKNCTTSLVLKNFNPNIDYNRSLLDDLYYQKSDLKDNEITFVKQFQPILKGIKFKVKSLDHLKICFFINDEIVKFYSIKNISFKLYQWLQTQTGSIDEYGK